jgi:hypothetical protein
MLTGPPRQVSEALCAGDRPLATDDQLGELWRRVEPPSVELPFWRNTPSVSGFRFYSGGDAVLQIDGDTLRLGIRWPRHFVVIFACLFLPTFAAIAWFMIPENGPRLFFTIGGPIAGAITFAIIYALGDYHERLGEYLVIDQAAKTIRLPRVKKEFPFSEVAFQWIRGRTRQYMDVEVDLNLLVSESGEVLRYHVIGNPSRRIIEQVICFSGLPLVEIDLGWRGFRDTDRDTHST